jgi:hypothetical protein
LGTWASNPGPPEVTIDDQSLVLPQQTGEFLAYSSPKLMLTPVLAESWSANSAGDVWSLKIRKGVKFHNGKLLTAKDVVATFDWLSDPKGDSNALSVSRWLRPSGPSNGCSVKVVAGHLLECPRKRGGWIKEGLAQADPFGGPRRPTHQTNERASNAVRNVIMRIRKIRVVDVFFAAAARHAPFQSRQLQHQPLVVHALSPSHNPETRSSRPAESRQRQSWRRTLGLCR